MFHNTLLKKYVYFRIPNVRGLDVFGKDITIYVLEGHRDKAKKAIKNAFKKYLELQLTYLIETFYKTDWIKLHSESVGGHSISRCLPDNSSEEGTIGCFLKLEETEGDSEKRYDGKIYAVTCHHVAKPTVDEDSILFKTTTNDGQTREFSREIEWYKLNREMPVDIALIPVEQSSEAFNFQHDDCINYTCDIMELKDKIVQKQGAKSNLTVGKIVAIRSNVYIEDGNGEIQLYKNMIQIESINNNPFSYPGDSGSLVTLSRNAGQNTHEAVSIVFAGGVKGGKQVSYTFDFPKAVKELFKENGIGNEYNILSNFGAGSPPN